MTTTNKTIVSKEMVKKVITKVTTVDENVVAVLPKEVFQVSINTDYSPRLFLNIRYEAAWVDASYLRANIVRKIAMYLGDGVGDGDGFALPCSPTGFGYIGIYWYESPVEKVILKEDERFFTILAVAIEEKLETEYISYSK